MVQLKPTAKIVLNNIDLKNVPSFNSIKPNLLEFLLFLTQPLIKTSLSAYSAVFLKSSLSIRSLNRIEKCVDSFDCYVAEEHKVCNNISSKELKYARRSLDDLVAEIDSTFAESLFKYIDDKGLTDPEVYKRANLDRKLFSKIRKNKNYKPSKNTALALAIALELNLDETKDFIGKAGYALTRSSKMDIIVEFFILQGNYDILELNEVLFYYEEPLLGSNVA